MALFPIQVDQNKIELLVNGTPYSGWKTQAITKNLEAISGTFDLTIADKSRGELSGWEIQVGDQCQVKIGNEPVITGWIDSIESTFSATAREISIKGRDKTGDLVDCSIVTDKSQYKGKTIDELATIFCEPFGITVTVGEGVDIGKPFPKWDVQQGETVFENLERMAKLRGVLFRATPLGNLEIVTAGTDRATDQIILGENLKEGEAIYDDSNRFSEYLVKGQSAGSNKRKGKNAAHLKDQATDDGVNRYRPLLVISEGSSDKTTVKNRAQWEATVRAAKAFRFNATVLGWRQTSGELWAVNQRVRCDAPMGGVNQDLLIANVEFTTDTGGGELTKMELVRPDAYKPQEIVSKQADPRKNSAEFIW